MKEKNEIRRHSYGLDVVRVVALLLIIMVHSFLNSGYNHASVEGIKMFVLLFIRNICFSGVLLFMILTGYLKSTKKVDKGHYKSIFRILLIYLIISILTLLYRKFVVNETESLYNLIIGIFNFTTIPYGWYVEMYIGLFLLIPFLNILYNNIPTKKQKILLLIILFIISSLFPTISHLDIANHSLNIFPDWWSFLYPILLYFVGAFIREYQIHLNKWINFCITILVLFLSTFSLYFYLHGNSLSTLSNPEYSSFPIIISIMIFLLLYNVKTYSKFIFTITSFISSVSFGAYLFSYCFDRIFYQSIPIVFNTNTYFIASFLITPLIFFSSIVASHLVNILISFFSKLFNYFYNVRKDIIKNKTPYKKVLVSKSDMEL